MENEFNADKHKELGREIVENLGVFCIDKIQQQLTNNKLSTEDQIVLFTNIYISLSAGFFELACEFMQLNQVRSTAASDIILEIFKIYFKYKDDIEMKKNRGDNT